MTLQVALHHVTRYRYDRTVTLSPQIVRLRPAPHTRTPVLSYSLTIEPARHFRNWQQDPHGNWLARIVFPEPVASFDIAVDLIADMDPINAFDFFVEEEAKGWPFAYDPLLADDLAPYRRRDPVTDRLAAFLREIPPQHPDTVSFLVELNQALHRRIGYVIRLEPGVQSPEETLAKGTGSCRDSAWLLVQALRNIGLAARFVSGYLVQLMPDRPPLDGPPGPASDFTDLHAWAEAYLPGAGWVGLDPTSGLLAGEGHIPLCATPEPRTAAPVSGSIDPCEIEFSHHMVVTRLAERPRVTKPYDAPTWADIDALGSEVDARLTQHDVRLTMGGEPTFVAVDEPDSPEWTTAALGPRKLASAAALIERLRDRLAPQGLVTFGQSKWYPGEPLPRWAYALYWRVDGEPLWRSPPPARPAAATVALAERFSAALAARLGVNVDHVVPAFEDPYYFVHRERSLPPAVDPRTLQLDGVEARASLAEVFERGLGTPRGWVLPIQRYPTQPVGQWTSAAWVFRRGHLLLLPGDSPLGMRLPLDSLASPPDGPLPAVVPVDPTIQHGPLPLRCGLAAPDFQRPEPGGPPQARGAASAAPAIRTALAVEPRDGILTLFFPPLATGDDFVALIAAVEDVANVLDVPVQIEGYPAPTDARLNVIRITPDPGVLEVNVHPTPSWPALRDLTLGLYEDAHASRLTTTKFLLDGRTVGTGGGNHVVLGAATPLDSPFLRRPDVLGSLIRFWQNHPSLSYFFAGLFIGPTSQHPRVDEARAGQLDELDLALAQLPANDRVAPPWLVDRVLRHLLVDVTGNTHRTEICIDKLYAPESAHGRLGLVELRGFEMPPDPRMSLTQALLVRALVSWFWERPYEQPLIRYGTTLHDRWMLPSMLWRDLASVVAELRAGGYRFDLEWFRPHFEFRFPRQGLVRFGGVELEFRYALEPWPVLGEEPGAGGTTRFVDSSLERLEVRAMGLIDERYSINCNRHVIPLMSTDVADEWVGGVQYRAWQPASCLHPTLGVDTPLVFDLYDRWTGRAVAGATHHVAHPAGRNYEDAPVNALEAASRCRARFEAMGHTPGPYMPITLPIRPEYPCTLDLRRAGGSKGRPVT